MKNNFRYRYVFVFMLSLVLYLPGLYAEGPEISWSNGYPKADDVNVGSDKPAYIYFRFDVIKASVPGAKIVVQFPNYDADSYNPDFPAAIAESGNFVDYTDKIVWDKTLRTLTFSGIDLAIGNYVSYKIPHKATDALAANINSGTVTIKIYKDDGTLISSESDTYLYRRAALSIVPASGLNNLSVDFGTNTWSFQGNSYTEQEYRFGLRTNGGVTDSVRVRMSIPTQAVVINTSSWKANDVLIDRVASSVDGSNTIFVLYLEKKHSIDADGFDDEEAIDISFVLKKRYCSNTSFEIRAAWGSSGDYMTSVPHTGSFAATSIITGTPELQRISVTLQNPEGKLHMDGITPNIFYTRIKNSSSTTAYDIKYHLVTPNSPFAAFLDDSYPTGYSIDNGVTWNTVAPVFSGSKGTSEVFLINPEYQGKKLIMDLAIDSLSGGKEMIIRWASCIAPNAFYNNPGVERNWYRSIRHDDSWIYTNVCRDLNLQISNQVIYNLDDILLAKNLGPSIKLSGGMPKTVNLLNLTFGGFVDVMGHTGALYRIRIALPKGIKISEDLNKPIVKLGTSDYDAFTKKFANNQDSLVYTFDFKQRISSLRKLTVTFETDCSGIDGLQVADVSVDYLPTGIDNGITPDIIMPCVAQFYIPVSVTCNTTGITYDFNMYRTTVGLQDANDDRIPDDVVTKISPSYLKYAEADLKQVVTGDTLVFEFDGLIKDSNYDYLYAVLFSPVNSNVFRILDYEVSGDSIYSIEMTNSLSGPVNTGQFTPGNFAYYWKITKGGSFKLDEHIKLKVRCQAVDNISSYDPLIYKFSSWFYTSNENINTITDTGGILNPVSRFGKEEYTQICTYYKGYFTGWSTTRSSINFTGKQWSEGYAYHNPFYNNMVDFSPYEYRHLVTIDSIIVEVPDGYLIDDNLRFTMTGFGKDNVSFYAKADLTSKTKRQKKFIIRDMYVADYGVSNGTTTIGMQDGPVSMTMYPMIKSTPRSPEGISICTLKSATDNQTLTHAAIPNASSGIVAKQFSSFLLVAANGPGIFISTPEAVTKNLSDTRMSWSLKVENTLESQANQIWLYVAGPVSNIKYNGVDGQGQGNRWVLIPSVPASGYITSDLTFDVDAGAGCENQQVVVYPVFDVNNNGALWAPFDEFTDLAFNFDSNAFDEYVYHELKLTLIPVLSQISGEFSSWESSLSDPAELSSALYGIESVEVNKPFTVEVVIDASASASPVANIETQINFPKGLKYVDNSAYIEFQSVNTQIVDEDWINLLETLTEINSEHPSTLIFKLKDIIDQSTIASMFGNEASISGGKKAIFRFQLQPTCNIDVRAEQISAKFSGKHYCDLETDVKGSNVQSYLSSKLTLDEALIPFNSEMSLIFDVDSITHKGDKDFVNVTFNFRKKTKTGEDISLSDSIRVVIPAYLDLTDDISYIYPAYYGHGLDIPEEKGTLSSHSNYEINSMRYISWALPQAYYASLASKAICNEVELTYNFVLETTHIKTDLQDTSGISIYTISEMAPYITCPVIVSEVDSIIEHNYLLPVRNALLSGILVNNNYVANFSPFTFEYDVIIACDTEKINIEGIPHSDRASVTSVQDVLFEKNSMRFELIVTAEDGVTKRIYVVNVHSCDWSSINKERVSSQIRIYPNPVSSEDGILTVESESIIDNILVIDINGRIIANKQLVTESAGVSYQLSTAGWPKGPYLIRVNTKNGVITQKIIKE